MTDKITIRVADIIGNTLCIASEDGQKIFDKLVPLIRNGKHIVISFERVSIIISLFLNAAIGQLYGTFTEEQIRSQLEVSNLAEDDIEMLKRLWKTPRVIMQTRKDTIRHGKRRPALKSLPRIQSC